MIKFRYKKSVALLLAVVLTLSMALFSCERTEMPQDGTNASTTAVEETTADSERTEGTAEKGDENVTESDDSTAQPPAPETDAKAEEEEKEEEKIELDEPMVLTYDNLHSLSSGKNIVIFLVDRFDAKYYRKMENKSPDFFERLDGFTYFNDYTSLHCRTYPGVASILTNLEHNYSSKKADAFNYFYSNGGALRALHESGYTVNVYTETDYVYTDATLMSEYVSNTGYVSLSEEFKVGVEATVDLKERLMSREFYTEDTPGQFTFIHLFGCHDTSKSSNQNIEDSFEIIYYYIDRMKALGVYEDATIAIMGDHASALSDSKYIGKASSSDDGTRVTAMLFKRSGESGTALARTEAQVSQDELWATIYESEGLTSLKKGESFFDIPEGVDRERRYLFYMYKNTKNNNLAYSQVIEYKITGSANNSENWEMITVPVTTD